MEDLNGKCNLLAKVWKGRLNYDLPRGPDQPKGKTYSFIVELRREMPPQAKSIDYTTPPSSKAYMLKSV